MRDQELVRPCFVDPCELSAVSTRNYNESRTHSSLPKKHLVAPLTPRIPRRKRRKGNAGNHEVFAAEHLRHFVDHISIDSAIESPTTTTEARDDIPTT